MTKTATELSAIVEAIREIAENYLYDGDYDVPMSGYYLLLDIADQVAEMETQ